MLLPRRLRPSLLWFSYSSRALRHSGQVHSPHHTAVPSTRLGFTPTWITAHNRLSSGTRIWLSTTASDPLSLEESLEIDPTSPGSFSVLMNDHKAVSPSMLAEVWTPLMLKESKESLSSQGTPKQVQAAISRTIPLLSSSGASGPASASVPFVCRYRSDVIHPLTTQQVHQLQTWISQHESLATLRKKLLDALNGDKDRSKTKDRALVKRILTSISKTELDDLYAPYKPPAKGSILQQIVKEHPKLVQSLEELWSSSSNESQSSIKQDLDLINKLSREYPQEAIVSWLGSKVAAEPKMGEIVSDQLHRYGKLQTKLIYFTTTASKSSKDGKQENSNDKVYENYHDFSMLLRLIKDHQILAIRRGSAQKVLRMSYDIDSTKMESCLKYHLHNSETPLVPSWLRRKSNLFSEVVHDAWSRLLRRRGTQRWWNERCKEAQDRASWVFANNLERALLAPPLQPTRPLLALDPGYQAGIKCAVLDASGQVIKLDTVQFLGKHKDRAVSKLQDLLRATHDLDPSAGDSLTLVALGNGHGTNECRQLIQEAASQDETKIDLQLVNEAGASVWSVSPAALKEFPDQPASAIASISIGRRLQNPLFELVKVPPKSLGLGMYQHDLSEKELEERLHLTSVDAVAKVGVDLNTCSLPILEMVPGLNKLAPKVAKARPFAYRDELLKVTGLGPKTYENCAGFLRVPNGEEPLDNTLVHPESYDLARFLLTQLRLLMKEDERTIKTISVPKEKWIEQWDTEIGQASDKFNVSRERVISVLENLIDSILQKDPRLESSANGKSSTTEVGCIKGCTLLPSDLATNAEKLKEAAPLRGIIATVRNIADFGAFIDFGGPNDGLLHTSKLGPLELSQLLIGQELGVDILQVDNHRISLGLYGLNSEPTQRKPGDTRVKGKPKGSGSTSGSGSGSKRSMSTKTNARKKRRT
ncbi:unnamed protein product [Cylindrotheca closterium]|uniref:S1 motif domain-containing protein n=1 Tax=Cylindrotheca closterium TaxID=2856 RepID=A0AAD2CX54_9STRA|nr:unnamed protein product [Cylindrotheca closterium]